MVRTPDVYDLTARVSESSDSQYVEELRAKMQETEQLVVAFVQLSRQGGSKITREDTLKQCHEAQTEVSHSLIPSTIACKPPAVCITALRDISTTWEAP